MRWMREPLQWVVFDKVWSHPGAVNGRIVNAFLSLPPPALQPDGKNVSNKGTRFPFVNHDSSNEALGESTVTTESRGDSIKWPAYFSGRSGPACGFRRVFIPGYPYSISKIFVVKLAFAPRDEMPPIIVRVCVEFDK
jgi:hypothetical protein